MEAASDEPSSVWRLVRTLRNFTALALLTLCLGVLALWVRSVESFDAVSYFGPSRGCQLSSMAGCVSFVCAETLAGGATHCLRLATDSTPGLLEIARQVNGAELESPGPIGFYFHSRSAGVTIHAAHWLIALVFAALAFALKPKPRLRFRLSDLLVLKTFAAVLVAGVASLTRLAD
jgi:hypothetical protein